MPLQEKQHLDLKGELNAWRPRCYAHFKQEKFSPTMRMGLDVGKPKAGKTLRFKKPA